MKWICYFSLFYFVFMCSCKKQEVPCLYIENASEFSWDIKEPCLLSYVNKGKQVDLKGMIKYRGGISKQYEKHSFALELEKKFSFLDLPKDDDWILNASYIDKTFMRHKISYDLFRAMNANNVSAKSAYLNLFVNQEYEGLYLIMEEVNAKMLGCAKLDTMAMLFKDPPIFIMDRLEYVQDTSNYYQQKFPKMSDFDKTHYIDSFKNFLFYSSDSVFAAEIAHWVDLDNVMDWQLLLLFSNNSDGLLKNFYLYKLDAATPFRFAIWDYDHSFGRDGDNELNMMERAVDCERVILLDRLMSISSLSYNPQLKKRWFELRDSKVFSVENFETLIQSNDEIISRAVEKNAKRWPIDNKWYYDQNDYHQELDLMRSFVKLRIAQLDAYFMAL